MTPEQFRESWLSTMSKVFHGPIKKPVYMINEFDQMIEDLKMSAWEKLKREMDGGK